MTPDLDDRTSRWARVVRMGLALLLGAVLTAGPAGAVPKSFDKTKAAEAMVQQASAAYEQADYARAAELYRNAFRTDAKPEYLYGAARAEQLAGQSDQASQHFRELLATSGADPKHVAKARDILAEMARLALDKRVAEGEAAARAGDYKLAAQIWLDVVVQAPQRVELYYRAGMALQQAGDLAGALAKLDQYLAKADARATDRNQALVRREAIAAKLGPGTGPAATLPPSGGGPVAATTATALPNGETARPADHAGPGWLTWTALGTGAAAGLAGLAVYLVTRADIEAYERDTTPGPDGKVSAISYEAADARAASIRTRETAALGLGLAGAALLGTGAVLWALDGDGHRSSLFCAPGPALAGLAVGGRF